MIKVERLDFKISPRLLTEGFTQSEMQEWDNCPERWYRRYNQFLSRKGMWNWQAKFGSWVHAYLEEFYMTKGKQATWNPELHKSELKGVIQTTEWKQEREYFENIGAVMMEIYASHYKHDFDVFSLIPNLGLELVVDLEYEGFRMKGMLDLPVIHKGLKKNIIIDHKTASRVNKSMMMGWDFRFQFMFYMWLAYKAYPKLKFGGFMTNIIRKPELKFDRNKMNIQEFCRKLRMDMLERTDTYFVREPPSLLKAGDMEHFEEHILKPKLARLRSLIDPNVPEYVKIGIARQKNTDYCTKYGAKYACPYLPLCQQGEINKFQYETRENKHVELEEAE